MVAPSSTNEFFAKTEEHTSPGVVTSFQTLKQKTDQLDAYFRYLNVEPIREPMNPAAGAERISYLWGNWFEGGSVLQFIVGHPYPVTILTTWEPLDAVTLSAIGTFLSEWAAGHPVAKVALNTEGVLLSVAVQPTPDWVDETWQTCLYDVWLLRLEFLRDLAEHASSHGLPFAHKDQPTDGKPQSNTNDDIFQAKSTQQQGA